MSLIVMLIAGTPLGIVALIGTCCKSIKAKIIWNVVGGTYTVIQLVMLVYAIMTLLRPA